MFKQQLPEDIYGELFIDVQRKKLLPDEKIIGDLIPVEPPSVIVDKYLERKDTAAFDLEVFVKDHFEYQPSNSVTFESDPNRTVEEHIEKLWMVLQRNADTSIPGSSLIPLPHPYIVPGGRFNEIYYWDSYFTMLGLKVSNHNGLIRSMISNFAWLIDNIGFIPNGNRSYFLSRSQPPFFSLMVELLASMDGNNVYVEYLPQMLKEYAFWMDGKEDVSESSRVHKRVVYIKGASTILNRYYDELDTPRSEMWMTDMELVEDSHRDKHVLFQHIRAACESGWDFSSRWLKNPMRLDSIETLKIVPVDLNSLLYHLEISIAKGYGIKGMESQELQFSDLAQRRKKSIQELFYNKEDNQFMDILWKSVEFTRRESLATMYPLFLNIATDSQSIEIAETIREVFLKPGGVVTTPLNTGQQWDAPNGWAPLQYITVKGLINYNSSGLAEKISKRWLSLNRKVYRNTGKMLEKYNVEDLDLLSGGGEYPVQDGFGWTNGVYMALSAINWTEQ